MYLIVDLACVLYLLRLLCFVHFVFFYGMALWKRYNVATISRLRSCHVKCMKLFFGYSKYHSVTSMLIELALPSFDTLIIKSRVSLSHQCQSTQNGIIGHVAYILFNVCVLSTVCLSLYVFVFFVFLCSVGLSLKYECIHSFIHSLRNSIGLQCILSHALRTRSTVLSLLATSCPVVNCRKCLWLNS